MSVQNTWTPPADAEQKVEGWNPPEDSIEVKKKVSYEEFQSSARGSSQMPKEYESEVPSTTTKKPTDKDIQNVIYPKIELLSKDISTIYGDKESKAFKETFPAFAEQKTQISKRIKDGDATAIEDMIKLDSSLQQYRDDYGTYSKKANLNPTQQVSERLVKQSTELKEAYDRTKDRSGIGNLGAGIAEGTGDYLRDYGNLLNQLKDNTIIKDLNAKLEKINGGADINLTDDEALLIKSLQSNYELANAVNENTSGAYDVGQMVGQSLGFMVEFIVTAGAGKVASTAIKGAVKEGSKQAVKISANLAAKTAQVGIQAAAMPSFYKEAAKNISETGNVGESLFDAYTDQVIEVGSEQLFMGKIGSSTTKNAAMKIIQKTGSAVANAKGWKGVIKGVGEEILEEKIAEIGHGIKDYDRFGKFWDDFVDKEQNLKMIASTSLISGVLGTANVGLQKLEQKVVENKIEEVQEKVPAFLKEQIDYLIENNKEVTPEQLMNQIGDIVKLEVKSGNLTDKDGMTASVDALSYASAKLKQIPLQGEVQDIEEVKKEKATAELKKEETPSYKIGDKAFDNKEEFLKEVSNLKDTENIPEININNDDKAVSELNDILGTKYETESIKTEEPTKPIVEEKEGLKQPIIEETKESEENTFNLREKELTLQQKEYERSYEEKQRGITTSETGGADVRGTVDEVNIGEEARYDVGASERIVGDDSVREISIPDNEVSEILKNKPNFKFDKAFDEVKSPEKFHGQISKSKVGNKYAASVFVYPQEEYSKSKLYLTKDGQAGLAITDTGDIISVFSYDKGKGRVPQLIINAVKEGGVSLDHYDTALTDYYYSFGFVPVARVKWNNEFAPEDWNKETFKSWNKGEPDVIAMAYHGGDVNTLYQRIGTFKGLKDFLDKTPYVETWEEAKKLQQEYVKTLQQGNKKKVVLSTEKAETKQEEAAIKQEKQQSTPKENKVEKVETLTPKEANKRIRGVEQGIFQETNSAQQKFVQELVDSNKESYDVLSLKEATEDAKQYIAEQGSVDEAYEKLKNNKDSGEDLATRQVARLSLIDYYSRKAINPNVSKAEQDVAIERVMTLEKVLAREATKYGQASAVLAIWKSMQPEGILRLEERKIAEYNDKILKKKISGKTTIEQQIDKVAETIDKEAQETAKDIVAKSKKYQSSKNKIANSDRKRTPKRAEANKEKIKAEKDYRQKRIEQYKADKGKTFSATIIPGITQAEIEFAGDMIASYVREGFYRLNDLTTKLKDEFKSLGVELTDKQIKQILAQEKDGKKLEITLKEKEVEIDLKLKVKEEGLKIGTKEQSIRVAKQLDDIVTKHWTEKDAIGQSLAQKFIDEAGLSALEAKELESIVLEEFNKQIVEKSKKELTKLIGKSVLPKEKAKQKSVTEKILSALNLGALETDFYKELFAEYFGLQKLSPEQAKTIISKAEKLQRLKGTGRFEQKASRELIDYIYELYPKTKTSEFVSMWEGLIYSSMLSGPFTSALNIASAGSNILLRPLVNLTNLPKWVSILKTNKGEKTVYNPFREIIAGWEGMKAGLKIAKSIYKEGGVETKFIEQTSKDNIYKANELERPKFGEGKRFRPIKVAGVDLNIFNYFKYSGRNLAAQDKIMFNTIHDMEMAAVIADKYYAKGERGKSLREKVISEVKGANIDQELFNTRLDNEISLYEEVTGNKATKLDIEIRRREIMLDMLDLTVEEKSEIADIAKSNIFTDDRHGTVAHMTQWLGTAANKSPLTKVFIKPFFMFTKIVGNVTEYMLDATPAGILRAEGISLTGAYKRFVDPDIQTSQMGERGSLRYYEQVGRSMFGTTAMVVAAALSLGNDDDDWFEITGGRNEEGYKKQGRQNVTPNYVVRFGDTEIPYKNVPLLAMPLSFIGNINDALKTDMSEEELRARITATLLLDAGFNSITMVKDMSIVEGLGSLLQLGTDVVNGGKWGEVLTETANRYITIAAKPLPQNTGIVQQTWQFFDRKSYSKKDIEEILAYSAGIQHLTNNVNRDQLGDEIVSAPGEAMLPYLHWSNIKGHDERWMFLSKYNAIPERIFNHQIRIETKGGTEKRKMTSDEYNAYTKLAGKRLSDNIVKYYNTTDLETRNKEKEVDSTTDKEYTGVQFDVRELEKQAKSDAMTMLFRWGVAKEEKPKEYALAEKYNALQPYLTRKTVTMEGKAGKVKYTLDDSELYRFNTLVSLKYLDLLNATLKEETLKTLSNAEYTDTYGKNVTALDNATTALWNQAQQEVVKTKLNEFLNSERVMSKVNK